MIQERIAIIMKSKGWLIGCSIALAGVLMMGMCVGLVGFFVFGLFSLTQPVVNASDEFLALLGDGKIAEAYASTAPEYRARQDKAKFTAAVKAVGLTDVDSVSWTNRKRVNQSGTAGGTVTTKSGAQWPVTLQVQKQSGKWHVTAIEYRGMDLAEVPDKADLPRMATETLLEFNNAFQAKDFKPFYAKISDLWKREITAEKLQQTFQEFIDKDINIGPIKNIDPKLDPLTVEGNGILVLKGRYPTRPSSVLFTLRYVRESGKWKLSGIAVHIGP